MLESLVRSFQQARNQGAKTEPQLIAVTSPHGSTGKTTVAISIALELAAEKFRVLIIDADLRGSSVANYLCLTELPAGLVGAARIASQNRFDAAQLERLSVDVPKSTIRVLSGLISDQPLELTSEAIFEITKTAKENYDFVVVDLGSLDRASNDQDFDQTTEIVKLADQVVLVAAADPVGIFRLLRIEPLIDSLTENPKLVVNRLRNSVIASAKAEINSTLAGLGSMSVTAFFPEDQAHVDQATRLGFQASHLGRTGSFRVAVASFTKSSILGRKSTLDTRVAKLG